MACDNNNYFLYISSDKTDLHPTNKPSYFKITLPKILPIDNTWQVSLVNIIYWSPFKDPKKFIYRFFVESDIVATSIVGDKYRHVLFTVPVLTDAFNRINYEPKKEQYVNISNLSGIGEISIYIKNELDEQLTQFENDLSIALHFKRNI